MVLAGPPGQKVLGPVVLAGQDLETLKVPGPLKKVPGPPGHFFPPLNITRIALKD